MSTDFRSIKALPLSKILQRNIWPLQDECDRYYGNPRDDFGAGFDRDWYHTSAVMVSVPWNFTMGNETIKGITIHKRAAASLDRVIRATWDYYIRVCCIGLNYSAGGVSDEAVFAEANKLIKLDGTGLFSGSAAFRNMRNGTRLSMHSYLAAIDLDANRNAQGGPGNFKSDHPIVRAFEIEGWIWGGRWGGSTCDPMHFQAARVHA